MILNRPTPEGRALGVEVGRMADEAERKARLQFPLMRARCTTCAFRGGTIPNGCGVTLMNAIKCVMEGEPFFCHEAPKDEHGEPTELCRGWVNASSERTSEPMTAPWDFV